MFSLVLINFVVTMYNNIHGLLRILFTRYALLDIIIFIYINEKHCLNKYRPKLIKRLMSLWIVEIHYLNIDIKMHRYTLYI